MWFTHKGEKALQAISQWVDFGWSSCAVKEERYHVWNLQGSRLDRLGYHMLFVRNFASSQLPTQLSWVYLLMGIVYGFRESFCQVMFSWSRTSSNGRAWDPSLYVAMPRWRDSRTICSYMICLSAADNCFQNNVPVPCLALVVDVPNLQRLNDFLRKLRKQKDGIQ